MLAGGCASLREGRRASRPGAPWLRTGTTRSWWGPAAPGRRPRCCSPARATGCSWSTGRRSRATRCRPTSSTRRRVAALRRWGLLDRPRGDGVPADRHVLVRLRALHDRRAHRAPPTAPLAYCPRRTVLDKLLVDARGPRPAPRSGRASPCRRSSSRTVESSASAVTARTGRRSPSTPTWWSGRTGGTRRRRGRPAPSSTTRSRRCSAATTRTGATCRWTVASTCYMRPGRGFAAAPTHDDLTLVIGGLAVRGVRSQPAGRRGQLPAGAGPRARVRRTDPRRHARGPLRGHGGAELLPHAPTARAGPSSATPGTTRTSSRRRGSLDAFRDAELCATALDASFSGARSFDEAMARVPVHARRARPADVRVHLPAGDPRAAPTRDPGSCWLPRTATRRPWTRSPG